jgi:hypothetical protein
MQSWLPRGGVVLETTLEIPLKVLSLVVQQKRCIATVSTVDSVMQPNSNKAELFQLTFRGCFFFFINQCTATLKFPSRLLNGIEISLCGRCLLFFKIFKELLTFASCSIVLRLITAVLLSSKHSTQLVNDCSIRNCPHMQTV